MNDSSLLSDKVFLSLFFINFKVESDRSQTNCDVDNGSMYESTNVESAPLNELYFKIAQ